MLCFQGSKSTNEIKAASAMFAKQIDDNLNGKAMLVSLNCYYYENYIYTG